MSESQRFNRYEKARIIGARALQVSYGAPVLLDGTDQTEPILVAAEEYDAGVLPFTVNREDD